MLPNERFALACRSYYDEIGLVVDERNGQFAHCPYPKDMGDEGYYLLWEHHQQQGLLQSRDVGKRCFFTGHTYKWLIECDPFPDKYFELWDIYEEFISGKHHPLWKVTGKKHPSWGNKNPSVSKSNVKRNGELHHNSKRIEVTFPDGTIEVFPCVENVASRLNSNRASISVWARKGFTPRWGKCAGFRFRYL